MNALSISELKTRVIALNTELIKFSYVLPEYTDEMGVLNQSLYALGHRVSLTIEDIHLADSFKKQSESIKNKAPNDK
jgi:hypothetical protein